MTTGKVKWFKADKGYGLPLRIRAKISLFITQQLTVMGSEH